MLAILYNEGLIWNDGGQICSLTRADAVFTAALDLDYEITIDNKLNSFSKQRIRWIRGVGLIGHIEDSHPVSARKQLSLVGIDEVMQVKDMAGQQVNIKLNLSAFAAAYMRIAYESDGYFAVVYQRDSSVARGRGRTYRIIRFITRTA